VPSPPFARSPCGAPAAHRQPLCRLRARPPPPAREPAATVETARVSPSLPSLGRDRPNWSCCRSDASVTRRGPAAHEIRMSAIALSGGRSKSEASPARVSREVSFESYGQKSQIAGHSSHRATDGRSKHRRPEEPIWQDPVGARWSESVAMGVVFRPSRAEPGAEGSWRGPSPASRAHPPASPTRYAARAESDRTAS
jgi:hypothetical protein